MLCLLLYILFIKLKEISYLLTELQFYTKISFSISKGSLLQDSEKPPKCYFVGIIFFVLCLNINDQLSES